MGEESLRRKKKPRVWKRIFSVLLAFAVVFIAAAWLLLRILSDGLPPLAADWLQEKLSSEYACCAFDRASFTITDGFHLENARIYQKHIAGSPLVRSDELDLKFKVFFDRPVYTWISSVSCKGFKLEDIPDTGDDDGESPDPLAAFLSLVSVKNEWLTTPIPVHVDQAYVLGFSFRRIDALVSAYGGKLIIDKVSADFDSVIADETGTGAVTYDPGPKRLTAKFTALALPPSVIGFLEYLEFDTVLDYFHEMSSFTIPFVVNGDIRWKLDSRYSPSTKDFRISVDSSGYVFRSIPIANLKLNMQYRSPGEGNDYEKRFVSLNPMSCQTDKGNVSVALAYYPEPMRMDFKVTSSIPLEYLFEFERKEYPPVLTNIVSEVSPDLLISGQLMRGENGDITCCSGSFSYNTVSAFGIPFSNCTSELSVVNDRNVTLRNFNAKLFGGDFNGNLSLDFDDPDPDLSMKLDFKLTDANSFDAFSFFGRELPEDKGRISASCTLSGKPVKDHLDSLAGKASVHIRDTHLLRIPIFAGLTDFLAEHVPGVNTITAQTESDLTASLTNGLITVSDFKLEGGLFSIISDNTRCRINKEGIPIEGIAKLRFFKQKTLVGLVLRVITLPVSKMMEFRITGPISAPDWNYIGLIDRITSIFSDEEDATALDKPNEPETAEEKKKEEKK